MNTVEKIIEEIKKAVVGKDEIIQKVLMAILAGGHILLEDVPGVGKTTLALSFSKALGLDYKRVQFTSDSVPSDIIGFSVYDKSTNSFVYKEGAAVTNLLLADEINRTSSKTQSALLEVMEEGQITVDGVTHSLPNPFVVIATQNPVGSAGTQNLPESQLDRFMIKLKMGYPDFNSQVNILKQRRTGNPIESINCITNGEELIKIKDKVANVFIDDSIYEYITNIFEKSRNHPMVLLGISPRGALALCNMVKAKAYVCRRDYVLPEDVTAVISDVFAHRLILNTKAKMNDISEKQVLNEILSEVSIPIGDNK